LTVRFELGSFRSKLKTTQFLAAYGGDKRSPRPSSSSDSLSPWGLYKYNNVQYLRMYVCMYVL